VNIDRKISPLHCLDGTGDDRERNLYWFLRPARADSRLGEAEWASWGIDYSSRVDIIKSFIRGEI
jgi:hypothetical protein